VSLARELRARWHSPRTVDANPPGGTTDRFGRALRDPHCGVREAPLVVRDGTASREHPTEELSLDERDPERRRGSTSDPSATGRSWTSARRSAGALRFRLVSPDRLREACVGTGRRVAAVHRPPGGGSGYSRVALRRR
jgi:hypothetical protein